jgi:hypothetical protein
MDAFLGSPGKAATGKYRKNIRQLLVRHMQDVQCKPRKRQPPPSQMPEWKLYRFSPVEKFPHGLYAASQPEEEVDEMLAQDQTGLEEVQGLRKLMERVMWLQLRT